MQRTSFSAATFVALTTFLLFSGQARRPVVPQPQPRQPAPPVQRQVPPPKPTTAPTTVPLATPTASDMPSIFWLPEDIKFPERPPGATREVTLLGDPSTAGLYVRRTLIPKGAKTTPHIHPDSRTITVLSGICYYGRGEEFDENRTIPMPPGSFFTEPAGMPHFIWAKDSDVIVQTMAVGPSGTQIIPDRKSPTVQGRQ